MGAPVDVLDELREDAEGLSLPSKERVRFEEGHDMSMKVGDPRYPELDVWLPPFFLVASVTTEIEVVDPTATEMVHHRLQGGQVVVSHLDTEPRTHAPSKSVFRVFGALGVEAALADDESGHMVARDLRCAIWSILHRDERTKRV